MPIERAQMRLRITASKEGRKLKEKLAKICTHMEKEEWDGGTLILVSGHITCLSPSFSSVCLSLL
jgi:ribosome maturation protein SDO1